MGNFLLVVEEMFVNVIRIFLSDVEGIRFDLSQPAGKALGADHPAAGRAACSCPTAPPARTRY